MDMADKVLRIWNAGKSMKKAEPQKAPVGLLGADQIVAKREYDREAEEALVSGAPHPSYEEWTKKRQPGKGLLSR